MQTDQWRFFDQAPGALVLVDEQLVVVRVNPAFGALVAMDADQLVGRDGYALMRPDERDAARERLELLALDERPYSAAQRFVHADGQDVWLSARVGVATDADGRRLFMAQVEDTTDHRRATERLKRLSERDPETGLLNRRRLEEELEAVLAGVRRHDRRAALVLLGVEHAADPGTRPAAQVLAYVAATLATRVREEDAVAHLGEGSFAVLLRDASPESAGSVATELVARFAEADFAQERGVRASAGFVALTPETRTAQEALHAADLALLTATSAGENRVAVHVPTAVLGAVEDPGRRFSLPGAAKRAADEDDAEERPAGAVELLSGLQAVADAPTVEHALRAVRELMAMDIAYVTQHTESEQVLLATEGDVTSFGIAAGTRIPLDETYCQQILEGDLPHAMSDVTSHSVAAAMGVTDASLVGAFVSVPVRLSDGTLFGTLCAASHERVDRLAERDLQFLSVLARIVAGEFERDAALRAQVSLRVQAAGAEALLSAIAARDRYTGVHSREVVQLATAVAAELGLPQREQHRVAQVALLHDLGKLSVPDAILSKPGPLTRAELVLMRHHSIDGEAIVAAIPDLAHLAPAIRAEHERWDGLGYPDGLEGEKIPIASRIVLVCDAWDAMISDRPYRARLPRDEAITQLAEGAGSQFCASSVQAFFRVLARG